MKKEDGIYSILDVAKKFNLSYLTVYRIVISGKLKAFKVGGSYRIHEKDLNEYTHYISGK